MSRLGAPLPNPPVLAGSSRPAAGVLGGAAAALLAAQAQARHGLRSGPDLPPRARCAYLGVQWSGAHDRRPEPGLLTRTSA